MQLGGLQNTSQLRSLIHPWSQTCARRRRYRNLNRALLTPNSGTYWSSHRKKLIKTRMRCLHKTSEKVKVCHPSTGVRSIARIHGQIPTAMRPCYWSSDQWGLIPAFARQHERVPGCFHLKNRGHVVLTSLANVLLGRASSVEKVRWIEKIGEILEISQHVMPRGSVWCEASVMDFLDLLEDEQLQYLEALKNASHSCHPSAAERNTLRSIFFGSAFQICPWV